MELYSRDEKNAQETPSCELIHAHADIVRQVNEIMPDEDTLFDLADLFKIFGDTTRIRILYSLFEAELCVCDLAQILGMQLSAVSHQLRILKNASLVKFRRDGKSVFYSLADDHVRTILSMGTEHLGE